MTTLERQPGEETSTRNSKLLRNPLNRDALNLPNLITVSRLVLAVVLFALIYADGYWITSAFVFVIAAGTDFLDGWLARKYEQVTAVGRILDPFADKIIVIGAFVFLLNKETKIGDEIVNSGVNAWMVIVILGREMFVTSLRGFLEQQGKDFSASLSGKLKMITQCIAVPMSLLSLSPVIIERFDWFSNFRDFFLWGTVIITLASGGIYIVRAVQLMSADAEIEP